MKTNEQLIAPFLDQDGKIKLWPRKQDKQTGVLAYLAQQFEYDRDYSEKEVNAICEGWHTFSDFHLLRRSLVDFQFLNRERDGSRYWRVKMEECEDAD